jgi:intergrase/recombinase
MTPPHFPFNISFISKIKTFFIIICLQKLEQKKQRSPYSTGLPLNERALFFRYPELLFRKTKMVYISMVEKESVAKIAQSKPTSYFAIRKRIVTHKQAVRIKELRSYFATYLRQHGILAEYIGLLQGRIPKISICQALFES